MKKAFNLFAALALAAGISAAPSAAAGKIKWACVKNNSWLLMRAQLWVSDAAASPDSGRVSDRIREIGGTASRESKPVITGRTACIKLPENARRVEMRARVESVKYHFASKTIDVPANSRHTHISVDAKTNWWGGKTWISGGPWQWTNCDKCSYNDF